MIAVIFEVEFNPGTTGKYLEFAAELKKELVGIPGFISVERFQSLSAPDKLLSLSFWADETAVRAWRNVELHRAAQAEGRSYIFSDYRLNIATVIRSYGMHDRAGAPADSLSYHQNNK